MSLSLALLCLAASVSDDWRPHQHSSLYSSSTQFCFGLHVWLWRSWNLFTLQCCQTSSSSVYHAFFSLLPCLLWYQEWRGLPLPLRMWSKYLSFRLLISQNSCLSVSGWWLPSKSNSLELRVRSIIIYGVNLIYSRVKYQQNPLFIFCN